MAHAFQRSQSQDDISSNADSIAFFLERGDFTPCYPYYSHGLDILISIIRIIYDHIWHGSHLAEMKIRNRS